MSQRKKLSRREQLTKEIMLFSHEIGRETTKQDIINMFNESEYCDEYSFLRRLRNVIYQRWFRHELPNETD